MVVAELFAKLGLVPDRKSWEKGHDLIRGMHAALAAFVGFKAFQSIAGWVHDTVEAGDAAVKTAQKLGVTAEAVQELNYAAGQSGTSGEALSASLGRLAKGLSEVAATGKGPTAEALQGLGISMRELKGETLDQNLELIASKFQAMPDGVKKTTLAMKLFGKSGAELIPLLNSGQDGIVALRNEAQELGVVIDNESAKGMEEFGDDVDRVKSAIIGMRNQAVAALLPTLRHMVEATLAWVKANKDVIRSAVTVAVKALIVVLQGLGKVALVVVRIFQWFAEHTDVARAAMIALGVVLAATAAEAIATWVAAAAAFAAPIAAIAALILILQDVWESFTTGKGITALVIKFIGDGISRLWRGIKNVFSKIGDFFKSIGRGVKNFFIDIYNWIANKVNWVIDKINWVLSKASKLPGVDIGSIGKIGIQQRDNGPPTTTGPTAFMTPTRNVGGNRVENNYGDINITTQPGQDPEAVAALVRKEINTHWSDQMNDALAGTGTA